MKCMLFTVCFLVTVAAASLAGETKFIHPGDEAKGAAPAASLAAPAGGHAAVAESNSGAVLVFVKGGCYPMGDPFNVGDPDEKPVHEVCVDDFSLGRYEVTQGDWQQVMGTNPSHFQECGATCPVEQVSWDDAQDFIRKLNARSGRNYRLPTEAEWEYAARSGGKKERFAGGADADAVAWHDGNSDEQTHPVGQKAPNGLGIHDMSGNVWEWVQDCKQDSYYADGPRKNPQGPDCSDRRVMRGGCWSGGDWTTRTTYRGVYAPDFGSRSYGLRLALTGKQ